MKSMLAYSALSLMHISFLLNPCNNLVESYSLKSVPELEKAMYFNAEGYPCVRLLNLSGEIGCSNPGHKKIVAPILSLEKINESMINSCSVLVPLEELENLLSRVSSDPKFSQRIAGVLVEATEFQNNSLGFSPDAKFPLAEFAPYQNLSFVWNALGSGILLNHYNFPIFLLADESTKLLREMTTENEKNYKSYKSTVAEFDLIMQTTNVETHDSTSCLQKQSCLPLGGYSVWSALPPVDNTLIEPPNPILLVMASMDSRSLFRDASFGADFPLSGLIALLAAVDSLSHVSNLKELKKQIVFAVFTGEAWGYLGSRRFLLELDLGADYLKGLDSAMIEQALEIGSVGRGLSQGVTTFFAHPGQDSSSTKEILDALEKAGVSLGSDNVNIKKADVSNPGVPPSSLMSFLRKNSSISGVVLEDFDTSFTNKFYNSHLDTTSNINSSSVAAAAIIIARTLYILASGKPSNLMVLNSIKVNTSLVEELVGCLTACKPGFSCGIVKQFISPNSVCPSHYVGVLVDPPPPFSETLNPRNADDTSRFVWNFLADRTSTSQKNVTPCKGGCQSHAEVCVAAETANHRCVESTTRYVPAYSTRLKYEGNSWQVLPANVSDPLDLVDPVWTESYWNSIGLRVYTVQSSAYDNSVLLAGISVTAAAYIASLAAKSLLLKALKHD